MPWLSAVVACFSNSCHAVIDAVLRDVSILSAGVALHCLSLAIPCKMVWLPTLEASRRTSTTSKSTTLRSAEAPSCERSSPTSSHHGRPAHSTNTSWVGTSTSKMSWQATRVTTTACSGSAQAKGGAVGLDVAFFKSEYVYDF